MRPPLDTPSAAATITVRAPSGTYPVVIGHGTVRLLSRTLDHAGLPSRRIVVSSPGVWRLHGSALEDLQRTAPILIPDGERFKTLATAARIYEALIRASADRATTLVALGGGVLGDMAGFAAATYLRGVPIVHVPTTLLAQVDSAIGGKVGVNHALGKNLVGAFHQPGAVVIDTAMLRTLPRREFRAGLYEVVKYGVIASAALFERVERTLPGLFARDDESLLPVIEESCRIKAAIVEQDEREAGLRRTLNFGHTIGHALEAVTRYRRFRHGEAIAYGMLVAAQVSATRGVMSEEDRAALAALIAKMGPLPAIQDLSAEEILDAVARDKKIVAGRLHFVLPCGMGSTTVATDVSTDELTAALAAVRP